MFSPLLTLQPALSSLVKLFVQNSFLNRATKLDAGRYHQLDIPARSKLIDERSENQVDCFG
uniref:Uncharacterized protein n=1 Tax=Paraburkholderia sprentiae WSM5005 TaxID=754502 RepID=A0A1I9YCQ3_9BURK